MAGASNSQTEFELAAELMAHGDSVAAANKFKHIAANTDDADLAANALFEAARLYETKLTEPVRARDLYQELIKRYPDHRTAFGANLRLEDLRDTLGHSKQDERAAAAYLASKNRRTRLGTRTWAKTVEDILAQHPQWSGAAVAMTDLARAYLELQRFALAKQWFLRAADLDRVDRFEHLIGAAEADIAAGRYESALALLNGAQSETKGNARRARALEGAKHQLQVAQVRNRLFVVAIAALALVLALLLVLLRSAAGSWLSMLRALAKPPTEIVFMLPVATLLVGASFTSHFAIGPAVVTICGIGVMLTWLSATSLRQRSGNRSRAVAGTHAVACMIGVVAACYIALHRQGLLDMLVETIRLGPDV